jgi:hypothetical protein
MPIIPIACAVLAASSRDVEPVLLCDVVDDEIVGSALAVYEYDGNGNPVGAPTFVDPSTGDPYVVQGTLQPCGTEGTTPDAVVSTGIEELGASDTLDVKAGFPGVQSVSVIVRTGTCNVTLSTGAAVPMTAGESATWSVTDTDDSSLAAASFATLVDSSALIIWSYKPTAAG